MAGEFGSPESAACGWPPRRAYPPYRSCGRVAEGGGLLNRYRVVKPYRGFESLRLRQTTLLSGPDTSVTERTQDMGDNLVPNGLSRGCRVFCSRSRYPGS